jgi:redox-sensitive bicupin YhaK (pirin superfamily)
MYPLFRSQHLSILQRRYTLNRSKCDPNIAASHPEEEKMPAVTVENPLVLSRLERPGPDSGVSRPIVQVISSHQQSEGAGFQIWRAFPGQLPLEAADPFLLLDQLGPTFNDPDQTVGAPWHPHRGIETVSYILDGEIAHHDSNGGGGVIREGDTQWMTAGAGILHDELPTEGFYHQGGLTHAVQLWVNLPAELKFSHPRYQAITGNDLLLLTTHDGGGLIRLIAGDLGYFRGPGVTFTPITYLHATVAPGAEMDLPWDPNFSAFAYVLTGQGYVGSDRRPIIEHQLAVFGPGDHLAVQASQSQTRDATALDVLILGGHPIREPIVSYGPFVMNSREEILQAMDDYERGRLGTIPADQIAPRHFA